MTEELFPVFYTVLLQLPIEQVLKACSTSKLFDAICKRDDFWQDKLWEDYLLKPKLLPDQTHKQVYMNIYLTERRQPFMKNGSNVTSFTNPEGVKIISASHDRNDILFLGDDGMVYTYTVFEDIYGGNNEVYVLVPIPGVEDIIQLSSGCALRRDGAIFVVTETGIIETISLSHPISKIFGGYALDHLGTFYDYTDQIKMTPITYLSPQTSVLSELDPNGLAGLDLDGHLWLFNRKEILVEGYYSTQIDAVRAQLPSIKQVLSVGHRLFALGHSGQLYSSEITRDDHENTFGPFQIELLPNTTGKIVQLMYDLSDDSIHFRDSYGMIYSGLVERVYKLDERRNPGYQIPEADHYILSSQIGDAPSGDTMIGLGQPLEPFHHLQSSIDNGSLQSYYYHLSDPDGNRLLIYTTKENGELKINRTWVLEIGGQIFRPSNHGLILKYDPLIKLLSKVVKYGDLIEYPDGTIMMYFIVDVNDSKTTYFSRVRKSGDQIYPP